MKWRKEKFHDMCGKCVILRMDNTYPPLLKNGVLATQIRIKNLYYLRQIVL